MQHITMEPTSDIPDEAVIIPAPVKTRRKRTAKTSNLYIDKNEMIIEILEYHKTGVISEKLGDMFMRLAIRYTSKYNFSGYTYRDDMIAEAVYRMVEQIDKFDVNHPTQNPFAYFTTVAHRQILTVLNKEEKFRDLKESVRTIMWDDLCNDEHLNINHTQNDKE